MCLEIIIAIVLLGESAHRIGSACTVRSILSSNYNFSFATTNTSHALSHDSCTRVQCNRSTILRAIFYHHLASCNYPNHFILCSSVTCCTFCHPSAYISTFNTSAYVFSFNTSAHIFAFSPLASSNIFSPPAHFHAVNAYAHFEFLSTYTNSISSVGTCSTSAKSSIPNKSTNYYPNADADADSSPASCCSLQTIFCATF